MFAFLRRYRLHLGIGLVLSIVGTVYILNAVRYNSYWAYDGGAHLQYIMTIAEHGRLPTPQENYIAWHEPLYYGINGLFMRALTSFSVSEPTFFKILQFESAIWALLFIAGAGVLAWILTHDRAKTFFVFLFTAGLFCVSAVARYSTNEIMFQAGAVWWMAWFCWEINKTNRTDGTKRTYTWVLLGLGFVLLLWVKLTALVLVAAVLIWLAIQWCVKSSRPRILDARLKIILLVACIVVVGYGPWLYHKHQAYGKSLTINNFETENRLTSVQSLPLTFYFTWDNSIFHNPLWPGGQGSFWSLLFGSAFGDHNNVFQNYEPHNLQPTITTANLRLFPAERFERMKVFFVLSLPLFIFLFYGLVRKSIELIKKREQQSSSFFVYIVTLGFLGSLVYNTWQYPFLERGTLKAIFILTFFPLAALIASAYVPRKLWPVVWVYMSIWVALSFSIILLPA